MLNLRDCTSLAAAASSPTFSCPRSNPTIPLTAFLCPKALKSESIVSYEYGHCPQLMLTQTYSTKPWSGPCLQPLRTCQGLQSAGSDHSNRHGSLRHSGRAQTLEETMCSADGREGTVSYFYLLDHE